MRQSATGDWDSVLQRVIGDLEQLRDGCFLPPGKLPQREAPSADLVSA